MLPSVCAPRVMSERRLWVVPFCPVVFNLQGADLSQLIAPPYDTVSERECADLLARHPCNIVRLILPPDLDRDKADRYDAAARLWRQWLADGTLLELDEPSQFVYTQRFRWRGEEREHWLLLTTIPLTPYEQGLVRPHEHTMPKPKSDRLALLRAMGAELSQVHGLISDDTGEWQTLLRSAATGTPWLCAQLNGVTHCVWRITDTAFTAEVNRLLQGQQVVIADGHHRYETALAFRDELPETRADPDHPANFVGIVLADHQRNATVLPTHRLLRFRHPEQVERVLRELMRRFRTVKVEWDGSDEGAEQLLAATAAHAFLVVAQGRVWQLIVYGFESGVAQALSQLPPLLRKVDTAVLHHAVLPLALAGAGVTPESVALDYTHDAATAMAFAQRDGGLAVLLRSVPPSLVWEVASAGHRMPPKTTYFVPKAPSGLVMRRLTR